jgi:hypothetical protein
MSIRALAMDAIVKRVIARGGRQDVAAEIARRHAEGPPVPAVVPLYEVVPVGDAVRARAFVAEILAETVAERGAGTFRIETTLDESFRRRHATTQVVGQTNLSSQFPVGYVRNGRCSASTSGRRESCGSRSTTMMICAESSSI